MESLWNEAEAQTYAQDLLALRAYTSRLIGQNEDLVLHGGGNTSVKIKEKNFFGREEEVLYVKGSGYDLATIPTQGFSPVRMDTLLELSTFSELSDSDMVREQKLAMTKMGAPAPSVEAILHALIPFRFVDHTHADAVVTITNLPHGEKHIREVYGDRVLYIPYVMPGFVLAKKVFELTRHLKKEDWKKWEGMVLLNHGVFTFAEEAKDSYEKMIHLVSEAENYLLKKGALETNSAMASPTSLTSEEAQQLSFLRKEVSRMAGKPMVACFTTSPEIASFVNRSDLEKISVRGPITPDHIIHTKQYPLILEKNLDHTLIQSALTQFQNQYQQYFQRNASPNHGKLDPAPRMALWKNKGLVSFGPQLKRARVVRDIYVHTVKAITWAENLGRWTPLPEKDLFEVEYWELEQAKLKTSGTQALPLEGKVALVTGGASGIGKATAQELSSLGAHVVIWDIKGETEQVVDVNNPSQMEQALVEVVKRYGGLDILVSNAGNFPPGAPLEELSEEAWNKTMDLNFDSHHKVLKASLPYLLNGLDPVVVFVGSKNVAAPGPGVAPYSCAKAALTQLARVAALELSPRGVRVNVIHPGAVFDTGLWDENKIKARAQAYHMDVEEYRKQNLLNVEITSRDIGKMVATMVGPVFGKVTGAQIPIDGGLERTL